MARFLTPTGERIEFIQWGSFLCVVVGLPYMLVDASHGWWIAAFAAWFLFGCVGQSVGIHRYYAHNAFKVPRWCELLFLALTVMAGIGSPAGWSAMHRKHHRYSDTERDEHSPGHAGLAVMRCATYSRGVRVRDMTEMLKDPVHRWVHNRYMALTFAWPLALLALDPLAAWFLWALPVCLTIWIGLGTNYIGHQYGTQDHATGDESRNNSWWALLSWGEGLHNNHHASPGAVSFSSKWHHVDVGGCVARGLGALPGSGVN